MSVIGSWSPKDPDERLDYRLDWAAEMAAMDGDTIQDSQWVVDDANLTLLDSGGFSPSFTDTSTQVWLSDGIEGVTYTLTNRVTTAGGRILEQSIRLKIKTK
jgi:hypothetical protein